MESNLLSAAKTTVNRNKKKPRHCNLDLVYSIAMFVFLRFCAEFRVGDLFV